jgi:hypothetical protein
MAEGVTAHIKVGIDGSAAKAGAEVVRRSLISIREEAEKTGRAVSGALATPGASSPRTPRSPSQDPGAAAARAAAQAMAAQTAATRALEAAETKRYAVALRIQRQMQGDIALMARNSAAYQTYAESIRKSGTRSEEAAKALGNFRREQAAISSSIAQQAGLFKKLDDQTGAITGSVNRLGSVFQRNKQAAQNFGFQIQDVAVQLAGGQNIMLVLSQQIPQLLGGFGALGAVIGAVLAVAGGMALAFGVFGSSADKTKAATESFNAVLEKTKGLLSDSAEAANKARLEMSDYQSGLTNSVKTDIAAQIKENQALLDKIQAGVVSSGRAFTAGVVGERSRMGGSLPEDQAALDLVRDLVTEVPRSAAEIDKLIGRAQALRDTVPGAASDIDALVANLRPLSSEAAKAGEMGRQLSEQQTALGDTAAGAAPKITTLADSLAILTSEATQARSATAQAGVDLDKNIQGMVDHTAALTAGGNKLVAFTRDLAIAAARTDAIDLAQKSGLGVNDAKAEGERAAAARAAEFDAEELNRVREAAARKAASASASAGKAAENLGQKYADQAADIRATIDEQNRLNAALAANDNGSGDLSQSVELLSAKLKISSKFTGDQRAELENLTEELFRAKKAGDAWSNVVNLRDANSLLEKQIEFAGDSSASAKKSLELFKTEQSLRRDGVDLQSDVARATLDETARQADLNDQLAKQTSLYDEISSIGSQAFDRIGSAITEAFTTGKGSAVDFASVAMGAISELGQAVIKLGAVNPMKNWLTGSKLPTLDNLFSTASGGGVGGLGGLSKFLFGSPEFAPAPGAQGPVMPATSGALGAPGQLMGISGPEGDE